MSKAELDEGNNYIKLDGSERAIVVLEYVDDNNKTTYSFCAEPFPDAIAEYAATIAAKYKNDINASVNMSSNVVDLYANLKTERLIEKSLYRLCELSNNVQLNSTDAKAMYVATLQVAQAVALAELQAQNAKVADSVSKAVIKNPEATSLFQSLNFKALEPMGIGQFLEAGKISGDSNNETATGQRN